MNPRTLWDCQPVAFMSSARLAPLGRLTSSSTLAPLLWGRRALVSLAGCAVFLTLGSFGAALGFPFAVFWPLGAPFALVAPLRRGGFLRRNVGALCRNSGGLFGLAGFYVGHGGLWSFLALR